MIDSAPFSPMASAPAAQVTRRPWSEVSDSTGLIGACTLCLVLVWARAGGLSTMAAMLLLLAVPALVMSVWTLLVEKAHLRESTGLDYSLRLPWAEVMNITRTKMVGLGATFLLFAAGYFALRSYSAPSYSLYLQAAAWIAPMVWILSPLYFIPTTRHMREPRDGLWHFGKFASLNWRAADRDKVREHLLSWTVKAFFLAFMISILPPNVNVFLQADLFMALVDPMAGLQLLIRLSFLFDVCFGTIGYLMTFRVLDSHIRTANPYLSGWVAALSCYPPFLLMSTGGPMDYRTGTQEWTVWLAAHPTLLLVWGCAVLALAVLYAWATVVFGIRFSNLTHRGIITAGPYRWFRHPAYTAKNLMWWMVHLPFLTNGSAGDAVRNCLLLALVNAVYYARAKTEERHLMADPRYREYSAWIGEHGVPARIARCLGLRRARRPA